MCLRRSHGSSRGSPLALAQAYETKRRLAEAFPDELSADDAVEIKIIKTTGDMVLDKALKDVGYCYGIDPDHVPRSADDPHGYYQSYSYCFGYINAMIQAVYA